MKGVAGVAAAGAAHPMLPAAEPIQTAQQRSSLVTGGETGKTVIEVRDGRLHVETKTLTAVIDKGTISSLRSKASGEEFVKGTRPDGPAALQLLYRAEETVAIDEEKYGSIQCRRISDHRAEVIFHSWDGDGVLAVSADPETGDLASPPLGTEYIEKSAVTVPGATASPVGFKSRPWKGS